MTTGYLSNGNCHASLQIAAQHFCAQYPQTVSTDGTPVTYSCAVNGTNGGVIIASQVGNATGTASFVTPYYANCEIESFGVRSGPFDLSTTEGALVGSAVVATWALAWGLRQLVRALGIADGEKTE